MGTISSNIKQAFVQSFQKNCITLVCHAHDVLYACHAITQDMDEETISTCMASVIDNSQLAIDSMIHVCTEHRLAGDGYIQNPTSSKSLQRIDFRYEMDVWEKNNSTRLRFYMEAKNLFQVDFKKSSNNRVTHAKAYFKRYVETGIDHIITGYYPSNTLLLGYVLVGDINHVVDGINSELSSQNRSAEYLFHAPSPYECNIRNTFSSNHSVGGIDHLLLKFT